MNIKINYNSRQWEMISRLKTINLFYRDELDKKAVNAPELSLLDILEICANTWKVDPERLRGKIDHANKINKLQKVSFWYACYIFSSKYGIEIRKFLATRTNDIILYRSLGLILEELDNRSKYAETLLQLTFALHKACPMRINFFTRVDFDMIKGANDEHALFLSKHCTRLSSYQISKIPIKSVEWFYNDNTAFEMLAYHPAKANFCRYIKCRRTSDDQLLFQLQCEGYRFVKYGEEIELLKLHPLCDKCANRNNCKDIGKPFESFNLFKLISLTNNIEKKSMCFLPLSNSNFKVDMGLLMPLETFRLQ